MVVSLLSLPVLPIDRRSLFAALMLVVWRCAAVKEKVLPPPTGKRRSLDHRVPAVEVPLLTLPGLPIVISTWYVVVGIKLAREAAV